MLLNRILTLSHLGRSPINLNMIGVCTVHKTSVLAANKGCPRGGGGDGGVKAGPLKRPMKSGKCRMGFIPDEWFLFFHSKTGYSGPYVFGIALTNYLLSKEIFIMEHEYYLGLSIFALLYVVTTKLGPGIGAALDKEVDDFVSQVEQGRKDELAYYKKMVAEAAAAQNSAKGQKLLMDAKKDNVALQLEAEYRERAMLVYRMVKGRMDYHVKRYYSEARIHQKWMINWILENVMKSITPDFEKKAMTQAISDLGSLANRSN